MLLLNAGELRELRVFTNAIFSEKCNKICFTQIESDQTYSIISKFSTCTYDIQNCMSIVNQTITKILI